MNINSMPDLIKVKEFADFFRISKVGAYSFIKREKIPVIKGVTNSIRIPKDGLISWMEKNKSLGGE